MAPVPATPICSRSRPLRLLATAEIILHDDLVTPAVLALANPRGLAVNVGKRCGAKKITQPEINRLMIEKASQGFSVVRLKSGDPLVFGRAGEEIDALREAGIPFEIVPGITAAFAAAASLQCSLTDRRASSSIIFSSGHHATGGPPEIPEPTRIVYMPGRDFSALATEWAAAGLPTNSPLYRYFARRTAGPADYGDDPWCSGILRSRSCAGSAAGRMGFPRHSRRHAGVSAVHREHSRIRAAARSIACERSAHMQQAIEQHCEDDQANPEVEPVAFEQKTDRG